MQYHQLGNSNLRVSEICLGTMTWGHQNSESDAHQQLDYAVECGVNFIDTAEMYAVPPQAETCYLTEQYLGNWLKKQAREKVIIATKMAGAGSGLTWLRNGEGLNPDAVAATVEGSLKRLQTDYIDLYQLHWPQRRVNVFGKRDFLPEFATGDEHILDMLQALKKQVDAGKIREIGVSNETPWGLMKYLHYHREDANLPRIQSTQNPYSLIQREFDNHTSEVCFRENIAMLAYSPLAGGILSGKYLDGTDSPSSRFNDWGGSRQSGLLTAMDSTAVKRYIELAKAHQLNPAQMALSFVNQRFFVTAAIVGATTLAQLKTAIGSTELTLSAEILAEIEAIHRQFPNPALM
ncbi:MAG: NADP(H)-dependent aldo-keto reductase [Gammaproteobacteria bacterium]|nr:MAG: NADP(H)-dependent aldo-keto reductase [Gammaproteobacteria bacterium]